jgi:L-glyceraldehyde reductase
MCVPLNWAKCKPHVDISQLETIIKGTGVVPAANQIERHPLLRQDDLIAYCKEKNIHITAYSVSLQSHLKPPFEVPTDSIPSQAFGNNMFNIPLLVTRPEVKAVAERLTKKTGSPVTPAQVL